MQYLATKTNHLHWMNTHFERNWKQALKKQCLGTDWWTKIDNFTFEICYPELMQNARHAIVDVVQNSMNAKYLEAQPVFTNQTFLFQRLTVMPCRIRKCDQCYNPFSKERRKCSDLGESPDESYDSTDLDLYEPTDASKQLELEPNEDEW